jgi:hypothetical protein
MSSLDEFNKIVANLEAKGENIFTDTSFPGDLTSYCKEDQIEEEFNDYEFTRAKKLSWFTDDDGFLIMNPGKVKP